MKFGKRTLVSILFLLVFSVFFVMSVSAIYQSTSYQAAPSYNVVYSGQDVQRYWPILGNEEQCDARQDVLLQVSPVGCEPAVVRSDLLADQNVPVFCQIDALEVNPLMSIDKIKNIRFTGDYPEGVAGVGFHPARAALNTRDKLLGDPLVNNVGYVVVVLKKTENEKDLPEEIKLNLSASIQYDSRNVLGVGNAEFLMKPVSEDAMWDSLADGEKDSFWQGRYFLRLEEANSNKATISVYNDDKKISTFNVDRGKISRDIYVPGFYCQAGLQVAYDGYVGNRDKARIAITSDKGTDYIDVFQGSRILNNQCTVTRVNVGDKSGNVASEEGDENVGVTTGSVDIRCVGNNEVSLKIEDKKVENVETRAVDSDVKAEFDRVVQAYRDVASDYPVERDAEGARTYGEEALIKAISFAEKHGFENERKELIKEFLEIYPESDFANGYGADLERLEVADFSKAGKVVEFDGQNIYLKVEKIEKAKGKSKVTLSVDGKTEEFEEGGRIGQSSTEGDQRISVVSIESDRVVFNHQCDDDKEISIGESGRVCGLIVNVQNIEFEEIAKVRLISNGRNLGTETNLGVNIGIEKRAIELSPEKSKQKINNLNQSIEKWQSVSSSLNKLNKGLKSACFATGAVLTVKNFFSGIDGKALAREDAMQGSNGWNSKCEGLVGQGKYSSVFECLNDNNDLIEKEVNARADAINKVNEDMSSVSDDEDFLRDRYNEDYYNLVKNKYSGKATDVLGEKVEGAEVTPWTVSDLREFQYAQELRKKGYIDEAVKIESELDKKIDLERESIKSLQSSLNSGGLLAYGYNAKDDGKVVRARYFDSNEFGGEASKVGESKKAVIIRNAVVSSSGDNIQRDDVVVVGTLQSGRFVAEKAFEYSENGGKANIGDLVAGDSEKTIQTFLGDNGVSSFENLGDLSGNEIYQGDRKVRFFSTGVDKGLPAVVPFDVRNGWYAKVDSSFSFAEGRSGIYQGNGQPYRWRVCNVGSNLRIDDGDACQLTDGSLSGRTILGLSQAKSEDLVDESLRAILDASRQKDSNVIRINGQDLERGNPLSHKSGVQCTDFMSASDCKILFNLCDPVICPSTRCDFGGEYQVANVQQTGIVGSALLCLPNYREGIAVPVCTTGIEAGIDGYVSILESHRDCLQENLETGRTTGICDQISSVYMCEFFWKQAAPLADLAVPTVVDKLFGNSQRGGGEYSNVYAAWDNAKAGVDYFKNEYAVNSIKAFNVRSVEEAGSNFCKAFVSAKVPSAFDSLIESDSPVQFHAYFDSFKHTEATVPTTYQYKVFYHIFAGNDQGVQYSVYLKQTEENPIVNTPSRIIVANGFIGRGEKFTETKDFTGPEGYGELCVRVNNQEECGFKQVSTSFAVNYLTDSLVSKDLSQKNIKTEIECVSGKTSLSALANPNLQAIGEEALHPNIEERGIVRVCSTRNPGASTEPGRYVDVGYCGDEKDRCWLDKKSVENAISDSNVGQEEKTLEELEAIQKEKFAEQGYKVEDKDLKAMVDYIKEGGTVGEKLQRLEAAFMNLVFNHHKARLLLLKGDILKDDFDKTRGESLKEAEVKTNVGDDSVAGEEERVENAYGIKDHSSVSGAKVLIVN